MNSEIADALRRAGVSQVDISTRRRAEYATDASLYRVVPAAVAFPRSADEVEAALFVCRSLGVPLTARGGGTSIAGNAVGSGVVLDFSRHLNRIEQFDPEARTAVVQPGVVLDDLQRRARPHGLRFGPDPSTHSRCTLGGMIGNNSCGSRALAYGRTADNVRALDLLTGTGSYLRARQGTTVAGLRALVDANLAVIRKELGRFTRQVSGYSLEHLLPEHGFHLPAALVGTEGT
ncbi:MAG TPA: FAD-binding oxidoreductase, partial [Pseudonocardiaceae bacterium]